MTVRATIGRDTSTLLDRPVFVIGCNRSGTTVLFQTLSSHPTLWSRYVENRDAFLDVYPDDGPEGNLVLEATKEERLQTKRLLFQNAKNRELAVGVPVLRHLPSKVFQKVVTDIFKRPPVPVVDKTPSNCFRVRMLADSFPRARFLHIVRRGEAVVSSLMEGWKNWTDVTEDWEYRDWHYLKPPGWREYASRPLEEICAFQFVASNRRACLDLSALEEGRCKRVRHEDLVSSPRAEYKRIRQFLDLPASDYWRGVVSAIESRIWTRGGSPPRPGKWRSLHGAEIARVRPMLEPINVLFYEGDEHLDTT